MFPSGEESFESCKALLLKEAAADERRGYDRRMRATCMSQMRWKVQISKLVGIDHLKGAIVEGY